MKRQYLKVYFAIFFLNTYTVSGQSPEKLKLPESKRLINQMEVFGGPNISINHGNKFIKNYRDADISNKRSAKFGHSFGVGIYHPITDKFSVNLRALFEQKGTKSALSNGSILVKSEYEYRYFTLCIAPRIMISRNIFASLGGYYSLLKYVEGFEVVYSDPDIFTEHFVGRNIRGLSDDGSVRSITFIPGLRSFHKADFGISIRCGYLARISDKHNILIEVSDYFGLNNINRLTDGNLPEKNHSINFTIGYVLFWR